MQLGFTGRMLGGLGLPLALAALPLTAAAMLLVIAAAPTAAAVAGAEIVRKVCMHSESTAHQRVIACVSQCAAPMTLGPVLCVEQPACTARRLVRQRKRESCRDAWVAGRHSSSPCLREAGVVSLRCCGVVSDAPAEPAQVVAYALARPAREVLFTVVSRDEKYRAKLVLDTAVQRFGDALAAGLFHALQVVSLLVLTI